MWTTLRFAPKNLLFHELPATARQEIVEKSVRITYGRLHAFPQLPRSYPHLVCLYVTDGRVPQLVACQDWQDVLHFQNIHSFDAMHPKWYAMRDWNAI